MITFISSVWSEDLEIGLRFSRYMMFPLSGCNSGFAYPEVNVKVLLFARVTVSELSLDGVPVADEVAPVITFAPLNKVKSPVELFVPKSPNLSC